MKDILKQERRKYDTDTYRLNERVNQVIRESKEADTNSKLRKEKIKELTQRIRELEGKKKKQRGESLDKYSHKLPPPKKKVVRDGSNDSNEFEKSVLINKQREEEIMSLERELANKQEEINELKSREKNNQSATEQKIRDLVNS